MIVKKFIDLFAGIGGFHIAFHNLGAQCVFSCEIDKHARKTYEENFKQISPQIFLNQKYFPQNILDVDPNEIPSFDVLCAGFPCQPFSSIGNKKGFDDSIKNRGKMFFEIIKILKIKRPVAFFLENVQFLIKHNNGETINTIKKAIESIDYSFNYKLVRASDHGLPQNRPRVFMIGFDRQKIKQSIFTFPKSEILKITMSDILGGNCLKKIGRTIRVGGRSNNPYDKKNWSSYDLNGQQIVLSLDHMKKMMGFPESFKFPVSSYQAMKQLGNSVAIPAVQATAKNLLQHICHI